jgi:hypothetical protein
MEESIKEYKLFCREISLSNFERHWEFEKEIAEYKEKIHSIDDYNYRCSIKINGTSAKMVFRSFFNEAIIWDLGKKSLPWEKNLLLNTALSLFEEFNNIMGASLKRCLEAVDCLDLEVPKAKKMGNERAFLSNEVGIQDLIVGRKSQILKDEWEIVCPQGTILNSLKTEIFTPEKFKRGDFNVEKCNASKGQTFFFDD